MYLKRIHNTLISFFSDTTEAVPVCSLQSISKKHQFLILPNVCFDLSSNFKHIVHLLVRTDLSFPVLFVVFRSFGFSFMKY